MWLVVGLLFSLDEHVCWIEKLRGTVCGVQTKDCNRAIYRNENVPQPAADTRWVRIIAFGSGQRRLRDSEEWSKLHFWKFFPSIFRALWYFVFFYAQNVHVHVQYSFQPHIHTGHCTFLSKLHDQVCFHVCKNKMTNQESRGPALSRVQTFPRLQRALLMNSYCNVIYFGTNL